MDNGGGGYAEQDLGCGADARFVYRLTIEDYEEAIPVQALRAPGKLICAWVLLLSVWFCGARFLELPVYGWISTLVAAVGVTHQSLVSERRAKARKAMGVAEAHGQFRMVANDHGVVLSSPERGSTAAEWTHFRAHLETPRLFVLVLGAGRRP